MKKQGTGNSHPSDMDPSLGTPTRDQGSEPVPLRLEELLRQAVPRIGDAQLPERDLWPAMARRLRQEALPRRQAVPWFDWALAGGLAVLAVMSPALIPVLLYYL